MTTPTKEPPMRHCFNCGEELGRYLDHDPLDDCGQRECVAAANDAREARDHYEFGRY